MREVDFPAMEEFEPFPVHTLVPKRETGVDRFLAKHSEYDGDNVVIAIFDTGIDPSAEGLQQTTRGKPKILDLVDASGSGDVDTSQVYAGGREFLGLAGRKLIIPDDWENPSGKWHYGVKAAYELFPSGLVNRLRTSYTDNAWNPFHHPALIKANKDLADFDAKHGKDKLGSKLDSLATAVKEMAADKDQLAIDAAQMNRKVDVLTTQVETTKDENVQLKASNHDKKIKQLLNRANKMLDDSTLLSCKVTELETEAQQQMQESQLSLMLQREELQCRVDLLSNPGSKSTDPGPVYDCVVFNDGELWRAAIDTTETGDFTKATVLAPYIFDHQYASFGEDDQMSYSINVYDEGNTLSIVTSGGAHGTHVASITAGYFPNEPEKNGIAPGIQIVGVKIGDTRLSTMETAPSLIRAANEAAKLRVDIINFSYGEACHWVDKGKVIDQFRALAEKHNITFVSSAGNNGPCLSTIGCPGANIASIIGVGALVSSDMMAGEYSMIKRKASTHYTWSSRGPVADGHLGISVSAPGGAITSVPRWTLKRKQLMNGTSMSCPSVSGVVALLISALKAEGIQHTPAMIKRSLENTATPLPGSDEFSNGHGVAQVDKAYEYIKQNWFNRSPALNVNFQVTMSTGGKTFRGVYLREVHETVKASNHNIQIEPIFPKNAGAVHKLSLDLHLALVSSQSWVHSPQHLVLNNSARQFAIKVDPTGLPPGAHYAEVCGYDVSKCFQGALFRVPVTVLIPTQMSQDDPSLFVKDEMDFQKTSVHRFFLPVPGDVTWAEIELVSKSKEGPSRVTVHTIQLPPQTPFSAKETCHTMKIDSNGSSTVIVPLIGGYVMELCCSQYWSDLSNAKMSLKVTYHSLHSDTPNIKFHCGESWARMDVRCNYRQEDILPELKLTHYVLVKRPHEYLIQPLGERDTLLSGDHQFELQLAYNFHVPKSGSEVRPICSLLNKFLYESPYTGQLWMLYNKQMKLICSGDAFCHQYSSKLDRGDYVVKLQVCHDKRTALDGLRDMVMLLEVKLTSSISVDLYPTMSDALTLSNRWHSKKLAPKDIASIFITTSFEEKLPRNYQSGDYMKGKLTLSKADNVKKEVYYPVHYMLSEKPKKSMTKSSTTTTSSSSSSDSSGSPSSQEYDKALKDLKLQWMRKKVLDVSELESEFGNDLDFLMARISCCVEDKSCQYKPLVASLVAEVYGQVNTQDILAYCGTKLDLSNGASDKQSQMEKARKILIDCLMSEGAVIAREFGRSDECTTTTPVAYTGRLEEIYITLHQLLDSKDSQLRSFRIHFARAMRYNAILAKLLEDEANDAGPNKDRDLELIRIFDGLGWMHYSKALRKWLPRNYPKNCQPF